MTKPRRADAALLILSGAIGLAYALVLFGPDMLMGDASFWRLPSGISGGSNDIREALCGYWWFIQDAWRWPLLAMTAPDWPAGANAGLFDVAPAVALTGKALCSLTGACVNPYPAWIALCFALNAVALTLVVAGIRGEIDLPGTVAASGLAAMAPMIHMRFGHLALMAHWPPLFMLALYFRAGPGGIRYRTTLGLCTLAALTNVYIYVLTAAIGAAIPTRALLARRAGIVPCALMILGLAACGGITLWALGMIGDGALAQVPEAHAGFSMNLLSPVWPQTSGLFRLTGIAALSLPMLMGTSGQYEGYCYLGAGGLLLGLVALIVAWRDLRAAFRPHAALILVLAVLTLWALSDHIYAGPVLVASYPMPGWMERTVLAWFRSSGRMFWPAAWLMLVLAIAGVLARVRPPVARLLIALALAAQWIDVAPWRGEIARAMTPRPSVFGDDARAVEDLIRRTGAVEVSPFFACASARYGFLSDQTAAAMEVQLMAARGNARMSDVYLARGEADCAHPAGLPGRRVLVTLRRPDQPFPPAAAPGCAVHGEAMVCVTEAAP